MTKVIDQVEQEHEEILLRCTMLEEKQKQQQEKLLKQNIELSCIMKHQQKLIRALTDKIYEAENKYRSNFGIDEIEEIPFVSILEDLVCKYNT